MKRSFRAPYDRTVNTDGSVDLKFTAERIGAHSGSGFGGILVLAMLPVSCAVTSPLLLGLTDKASIRNEFPAGAMAVWLIVAVGLWIFLVRKFNFKKSKVTIRPTEGIIFGGKQLPFKDIEFVGTLQETTDRNPKGNAYVCAKSHGTRIAVTGYVTKELAKALANDINAAWGKPRF